MHRSMVGQPSLWHYDTISPPKQCSMYKWGCVTWGPISMCLCISPSPRPLHIHILEHPLKCFSLWGICIGSHVYTGTILDSSILVSHTIFPSIELDVIINMFSLQIYANTIIHTFMEYLFSFYHVTFNITIDTYIIQIFF